MKRKPYFAITGAKDKGWHWTLFSPNSKVLARGPQFGIKSRAAAVKAVERLQDECAQTAIYVNGEELQ